MKQDDIRTALQCSGYPFEMRLLSALDETGIEAHPGVRVSVQEPDGGRSREVDVLAEVIETRLLESHAGMPATLSIRAVFLVEAKALEPDAAMILFPWSRPSAPRISMMRSVWGGLPCMSLPAEAPVGLRRITSSDHFQEVSDVPYCVQWAVARHKKTGSSKLIPFADQENSTMWPGIDTLVRASYALALAHSEHTALSSALEIVLPIPVLALAFPLWLADTRCSPDADSYLTPADRAMLVRTFDVGGRHIRRVIDVVTETAFKEFVESWQRAIVRLADNLAKMPDLVVDAAAKQVERTIHEQLMLRLATTR